MIYGFATGDYIYWRQHNAPWSNIRIGNTNKTIDNIGCLVTSIAILIEKSGVYNPIQPFNPGTFVEELNKHNGFDKDGNLYYGPISDIIPDFKYQGRIDLTNKTKDEKLHLIKEYFDKGYHLSVEVMGNTGQHWVAITKIEGSNIIMIDPATDNIKMWNAYNWKNTSQFIYFCTNV